MKRANLLGKKFCGGDWVVAVGFGVNGRGVGRWGVMCVWCGETRRNAMTTSDINAGRRPRCFTCRPVQHRRRLTDEQRAERNHGLKWKHKKEYDAWSNMRGRCNNRNDDKFPLYGGRGTTVCERWMRSFIYFFADVGPAPFPGASLDRIDGDGNYEPSNVRWATVKEQNNHLRRPAPPRRGADDDFSLSKY